MCVYIYIYIYISTLYAFFKISHIKIKRKDIHIILSYISTLYESSTEMRVLLYKYIYIYIYIYIYMYIYIYIYIYLFIYIYIYILFLSSRLFPFVDNCPRR